MRSIRARLTSGVVIIICACFIAVTCSVFFTLGAVYRSDEGTDLCDTAERLSKIAAGVMGKTDLNGLQYSNLLELVYREDIEAYSKSTGYFIITVDKYNRVIFSSSNAEPYLTRKGYPSKYIAQVLEGNKIRATAAMSEYYGMAVITAAEPVVSGEEVIGAVICSLPANYLASLRMSAMCSILLVMIPTLIISILIIMLVSFSITKPITKVSRAAKLIARGDLSQRVDINANNEIGELAANFNEMAAALENADKMKNSFISDVSHELRTPMTTIIGFLQGIQDGVVPKEEQKKYIGICLDESRRLSRLVTRLLDVARLESGENEIDLVVFDINEKIRTTVFKLDERIREKKLTVHAEYENAALNVLADEDGIDRVLTNLIDNAVKFSPENGNIIVSAKPINGKAEIKVSNSGDGIPPEDMQGIWDKFYKSDKSRSKDKTGTGLGLFFVKKIINNHGERITVSCEENQQEHTVYTTFRFELKLAEKES